jgi:hypothetical protein
LSKKPSPVIEAIADRSVIGNAMFSLTNSYITSMTGLDPQLALPKAPFRLNMIPGSVG